MHMHVVQYYLRLADAAHLLHERDIPAVEVQRVCLEELFSCLFQLLLRQPLGLRPEFVPALTITMHDQYVQLYIITVVRRLRDVCASVSPHRVVMRWTRFTFLILDPGWV